MEKALTNFLVKKLYFELDKKISFFSLFTVIDQSDDGRFHSVVAKVYEVQIGERIKITIKTKRSPILFLMSKEDTKETNSGYIGVDQGKIADNFESTFELRKGF